MAFAACSCTVLYCSVGGCEFSGCDNAVCCTCAGVVSEQKKRGVCFRYCFSEARRQVHYVLHAHGMYSSLVSQAVPGGRSKTACLHGYYSMFFDENCYTKEATYASIHCCTFACLALRLFSPFGRAETPTGFDHTRGVRRAETQERF